MENKKEKQQDIKKEKKQQPKFDPYAPHKIKWWGWPLLILLIIGTIYIFRNNQPQLGESSKPAQPKWEAKETQHDEGSIFGTFYHITYQSTDNMQEGINAVLKQVDQSLSPFNKSSVITAINENTCMNTDSMFTEVFLLAQEVSEATNGAFDITVAPLVNLWGFGFKNIDNVNDTKVDSILPFIGYQKVRLVNGKIEKEAPQLMLDCSAIAKGYGVDAAGKYLESKGIKNYMVEIGGEIRVRGTNPQGELWRIGINTPKDDPTSTSNEIEEIIQVPQLSMATSGNYRNYYEKDGKKFAHTIDPRTGYPIQHNILSSTVLAQDCATADAYATAFMVLGLEEAQKILNEKHDLMAFFIYSNENGEMEKWHTENLNNLIVK